MTDSAARFLVWVSGPAVEVSVSTPWWELPLEVSAADGTDAIRQAVELCAREGRVLDRVTATRLADVVVSPPAGPASVVE